MNKANNYDYLVNKKVRKKSDKPFKSTLKINTIKEVILHPFDLTVAFTFNEDDSIVKMEVCEVINDDK